jgi:hypothetical protein
MKYSIPWPSPHLEKKNRNLLLVNFCLLKVSLTKSWKQNILSDIRNLVWFFIPISICLKGSVDYAKSTNIKIARYNGKHDTVRSDYTPHNNCLEKFYDLSRFTTKRQYFLLISKDRHQFMLSIKNNLHF